MEIEVKSPCDDLARIESRLIEMGAKRTGNYEQEDVYLAHPNRDFGATDEALRIRREGIISLTYKGPKLDPGTKSREEISVEVSDFGRVLEILERLGFREAGRIRKTRTTYSLRGVTVSLDRVRGLGDFVEAEYEGENLGEGRSAVLSILRDLGLQGNERRSNLELLMEKSE